MGWFSSSRSSAARIVPKEGDYFKANGTMVPYIYGECLESGPKTIRARCYSRICPEGESGSFPVAKIMNIISEEDFEKARVRGW